MQEQNSMAIGKTFKIINFKVLPQNDYFLAGGGGESGGCEDSFPQMCKEKKKGKSSKKIFLR